MSAGFRSRRKERRRDLQQRAAIGQSAIRTLAAILIEHDGVLVVKRENLMLANGLRVDAEGQTDGSVILRLQDESGKPLPSKATGPVVEMEPAPC